MLYIPSKITTDVNIPFISYLNPILILSFYVLFLLLFRVHSCYSCMQEGCDGCIYVTLPI